MPSPIALEKVAFSATATATAGGVVRRRRISLQLQRTRSPHSRSPRFSLGNCPGTVLHPVTDVAGCFNERYHSRLEGGKKPFRFVEEDNVMAWPLSHAATGGSHHGVGGFASGVVKKSKSAVEIDAGNRSARQVTIRLVEQPASQHKVLGCVNRLSAARRRH